MEWRTWFLVDLEQLMGIFLSVIGFYFCLIFFTRMAGLRSFSKLSSYDFAMTIGIGSILASTVVSKSTSLSQGLFAVGMLFALQTIVSLVRRRVKFIKALLDNQAIILMVDGEYLSDNLREAKLSRSDVQEVLRKHGIKSKSEVFAVIMETTADMSVIKNNEVIPDWSLFDDVRDSQLLAQTYNSLPTHTD